ncbi:MAG: hypothetical protein LAT64_03250 [Phycisphaerales bacterium]|nr:hypothetical protein [Planctomycetota bacterium]MCH8507772.1 hypothetical protein [Phycisphaerales bacterium]
MDAPPAEPTAANGTVRARVMAEARRIAGEPPKPQPRAVLCPYCGSTTPHTGRCAACGGRFDPLSRQATQNHMGPWSVRDDRNPHRPGCTYDTLCRMIDAGTITPDTVLRGPTTRQFWTLARSTPGVAHRLGFCHNCREPVAKDAFQCPACHAPFAADRDRQHLGIGPYRPLPGQGTPEVLALHAGPARSSAAPPGPAGAASALPRASPDDELLAMAKRAQSAAAEWRRASRLERTRAMIAMILAGLVVIMSLLYTGLSISRNSPPPPSAAVAD